MPIPVGCALKNGLRSICYLGLMTCIWICWILNTGARAENQPGTPGKILRFAAIEGLYSNVSRRDGRMALELLMQKTIIQKNYPYTVKLLFIDKKNDNDIVKAMQTGGYHFFTLSGIDYFKYCHTVHLEPILIPSKIDQTTQRLLFLIKKDQTLSALRQKAERTLIIEYGTSGDLSKMWLDTLLVGRGFDETENFFTSIRRVNRPSRAILPVFFNQADACIVTQNAWEVIQELNPQIGQRVKSPYQSKGLMRLLICATDNANKEEIDALVRESVSIESNPDTRQAMTILQMKRFLRIYPEDLAATEDLLQQHKKITAAKSNAE